MYYNSNIEKIQWAKSVDFETYYTLVVLFVYYYTKESKIVAEKWRNMTNTDEKKIDRRVVKTKKAIKNAFAQLLTEKEINDITISDIAEYADVNRKTFYNYYAGVYAVVDEIENDIVERFSALLADTDIESSFKNA